MAMDTGCLEVVVNRNTGTLIKILRVLAIIFAVCFIFLAFVFHFLMLIPGIIFIIIYRYAYMNSVVDYEYTYVDREIRIARIQQKEKRRELGTYDLEKMELLAPLDSDRCKDVELRRKLTVHDYSSGTVQTPDRRYALIMNDGTELILELDNEYGEKIIGIVRNYYPGKTVLA